MFIATDHDNKYGPESFEADTEERRPANEKNGPANGASHV